MSLFFPEQQLIQSPLHVNTTLTTVGKIVESRDFSKKSTLEPKPQTHPSTSAIEPSTVFEGWHKSWEETIPTNGIITPNIRWIKHNIEHGLFLPLKPLKNKYSEIVERKLLKNRMEFNPLPNTVVWGSQYHTARGTLTSQTGILQYVRPSGAYTPPIPQSPLPSARVRRRAHLLLEIKKRCPTTEPPSTMSLVRYSASMAQGR